MIGGNRSDPDSVEGAFVKHSLSVGLGSSRFVLVVGSN